MNLSCAQTPSMHVIKSRKKVRSLWVALVAVALLIGLNLPPAMAQSYLENIGTPSFTTALPVPNGFLNVANGSLHLEIPMATLPQRGGSSVKVALVYDSAVWSPVNGLWEPDNIEGILLQAYSPIGGWHLVTSNNLVNWSYTEVAPVCSQDGKYEYFQFSNFIWTDADQTTHLFPIVTIEGNATACGTWSSQASGDAFATDASGYHMFVTGYNAVAVYAPDGTNVTWGTDTNGNELGSQTYGDTIGRGLAAENVNASTVNYYSGEMYNGSDPSYNGDWTDINVYTNFHQSGVSEYSGNFATLTDLHQPDSTAYHFTYDSGTSPGHYGLITSMTLPTGGTVNFTWSLFTDANGHSYNWLTNMATPDGTWTFTPQVLSNCGSGQVNCEQQVTVKKPSGDTEIYTFALNGSPWPVQVKYYTGSSNLLATTTQCFSFVTVTNGQCSYSVTTAQPATNVTKKLTTTSLSGGGATTTEYSYDNYDNITQKSEWNFYSGSLPATADRTTTITYLNSSNYISANILNRPTSVTVTNSSGTTLAKTTYSYDQYALTSRTGVLNHDDTDYGTGNNVRGNVTQIGKWLNTTGGSLTTTNYYNTVGNLIQTLDPNGNTTSFSYADNYYSYTSSSPTDAFVTQITAPVVNGVNHITRIQYYFSSALPSAVCGANFTSTCSYGLAAPQPDYESISYDSMNRVTGEDAGDGGTITEAYGTSTPIGITTTATIDSTHSLTNTTVLDGLGHTSQTQTSSPQGTIYVDTTYDSNGRTYTVSNPHYTSSSPTDGTSTYTYDGLDRITSISEPSGGTKTLSYTPQTSSILVHDVDEVSNIKDSEIDAFGRTVQVSLFPASGTVYTYYTYDLLNNLTKVDEAGTGGGNDRIRTFIYDSLSRLLSVTNPESATTCYGTVSGGLCQNNGYDANGNLIHRTDARGITTTSSYDSLNRLTSRSYNDGVTPTANFVYDACPTGGCPSGVAPQYPVGRVVKAYNSNAQTYYSYDVLGRNAEQWQCTPLNCGTGFIAFTYTHNYLAEQSSISYNGNFTISQAYDAVGRITQLTNSVSNTYNPATIINVSQFSPIGLPTQLSYGNGLAEVRSYNNRLQPTQMRVYTPPSTDTLNQTFTWTNPQNQNNGVLTGFAASGTGTPTFSRTYTYDGINRLGTMSSPADPSGCTGLSWTYDAWGNRTNQTTTGGTCGQSSLTINTNNEITNTGFGYDADGNSTVSTNAFGSDPYQFDAENRITQFANGPSYSGDNYVYDANGRRIEKVTPSGQVHYFYDEDGRAVVETDQTGTWTKDYVYMGGQHVAEFSGGQTYWIHTDHLGSTRTITSYQGWVTDKYDFLPYGEQILGGNWTTHKFAGYERDYESTLDYANARFYSSSIGRFMSVDPAPGDVSGPQTYNRYAYVLNDPANSVDPSGLFCSPNGCPDPCDGDNSCNDPGSPGGGGGSPGGGGNNGGNSCSSDPYCSGGPCTGVAAKSPQCARGGPSQPSQPTQPQPPKVGPPQPAPPAPPAPQTPPSSPNACEQENLNAVNNQFGTGISTLDVEEMFQYSVNAPAGQGTLNLNIQYQTHGISPGRYPVNWWTYIIGYGPTLHIPAGPGGLDSPMTLVFSNSQFTEHLDSAFAYNPIGALIHLLEDIFGIGGHNQCP